MLDIVKQLFENNVISEEIKSEIETAWQSRVQENREQVTSELREEFASKYEHDKSLMVNAVEEMLSERLAAELEEFAEDRNSLIETRAKYTKKMKKDAKAMESFILSNLKRELSELQEDRKTVAANIAKLESFIVDTLANEIVEFHTDKKDLAETKVKLIRDSKAKFESAKKEFISKASKLVSETVSRGLKTEISQLREDIESARKNDFGRRIFESFASEYTASHLNEKSETARLLKVVAKKQAELSEAAKLVAKTQQLLEKKEVQLSIAKDTNTRNHIMSELLGPLSASKREVMKSLLESVKTDRLHSAFDKYLPSVLNEEQVVKKTLTEGTAITGDKKAPHQGSNKSAEIIDIRRLAGLKV